jgi:hypothetical protein
MSDTTPNTDTSAGSADQTSTQADTATPAQEAGAATFSAEYVKNLRAESAGYRTKAKEAGDRVAELEAEVATVKAEALRTQIAAEHGIDGERAALLLTGSDKDTLIKQAQAIAGGHTAPSGKKTPPPGSTGQPATGGSDTTGKSGGRSAVAALRAFARS